MKRKPVVPRAQATRDAEAAIGFYRREGSAKTALAFVNALEAAFGNIQRHPAGDSPRYGHELNLPYLRAWQVKDYPYLIFYVEGERHIEVWRILHGERDIPAWLQAPPIDTPETGGRVR